MSIAELDDTPDVRRSTFETPRGSPISTDVVAENLVDRCVRLRSISAPALLNFGVFGCDSLRSDVHDYGGLNETLSVWRAAERRYRPGLSTLASWNFSTGSNVMGAFHVDDASRPEVRQIVDIAFLGDWAPEARSVIAQAAQDALLFVHWRPAEWGAPTVSATDDGEILLEWLKDGKEAIVSFDGDECFGYAVLEGEHYLPGAEEGRLDGQFEMPSDLVLYLSDT